MKHLNQASTRTLIALLKAIPEGKTHTRINNTEGAFMAVSVEVLRQNQPQDRKLVSVAHRHEVNGELVADPDVEFLVCDLGGLGVRAYPTAINHGQGAQEVAILDNALNPTGIRRRAQADVAAFSNIWMTNIRAQQKIKMVPLARRVPPCAASMGCLCALHARKPNSPEDCNASEGV